MQCARKKKSKMSQLVTFYSTVCNTTNLPLDGVILHRMHTPTYGSLLSSAASSKQGGKGELHTAQGHFLLGVGVSYGFRAVSNPDRQIKNLQRHLASQTLNWKATGRSR